MNGTSGLRKCARSMSALGRAKDLRDRDISPVNEPMSTFGQMISQTKLCVVNVRKVAALIVGLSVVVGACGGDDDTSTTESQATTAPTAEAEPTTEAETTTEEAPTTEAESGASPVVAMEPMSQEDAATIDAAAMAGIEESGGELPGSRADR